MNEIRTRTLTQARDALLVARARCLPPGYYPDTMTTRVEESAGLLTVAIAAAKMAAAVLVHEKEHGGLAVMLRKAASRGAFILELDPAELTESFAAALPPEPVEEVPTVEPDIAKYVILDE